MAPADRAFYEQLGQRIAEHRKARGITQVELAKTLGIAQQTLAHYEGGTVRIAVATLTVVAKALDVAMEDLLGSASAKTAGKRGPAPKLQRQLELVSQLPKAKQRLITEVLDSMLAQAGR
ncbi:helix-turn-helix domain-containing protein [Dyella sp. AD56]|uniref:helix-turn-helix domain-containing protein n=1 Tax=Dyella sp. AD56 TaxID=1528744 RepID=UPI0018EB89E9|nr:helix-turn-helix domain-containing protein [Dyella sp. AD56]